MENNLCKNCGTTLIIKQTKRTSEQLKKAYYYTAYYFCPSCHKLYHDEKFKVENEPEESLFSRDTRGTRDTLDTRTTVHIWTDGACTRNGYDNAKAAWAFVTRSTSSGQGGGTEKAGIVIGKQTNNTAEGYAIYHALLWAAEEKHKMVKIYSDSQITLNNLTKSSYLIKENRMIFELIEDVISANGLTVDYEKVPAHADNVNNNRADRLANTLAGIK